MTETDKSTPRPWKEGEGRVVYYGEVERTEKYPSGTYALLEFPKGPIGVTFGDIWRETPMRLIPVNSYPALEKCREALIAAKQHMWIDAAPSWTMADFKNWATVQQIDEALALLSQAEAANGQ